jgi:hypothetical protein
MPAAFFAAGRRGQRPSRDPMLQRFNDVAPDNSIAKLNARAHRRTRGTVTYETRQLCPYPFPARLSQDPRPRSGTESRQLH